MSLTAWNPISELEVMRRQMDRMFNQVMTPGASLPRWELARPFMPNVDVYTSGKELVVAVELSGFRPEDVTLEATEGALHLAGEVKREEEIKEDNYYRSERQYGSFDRVIPLPYRIKEQEAKATFRNGLLTIRAPLAEELKAPRARKLAIDAK